MDEKKPLKAPPVIQDFPPGNHFPRIFPIPSFVDVFKGLPN